MRETTVTISGEKARAISDLFDAVRGHHRGEDWDKEMREAVWEIERAHTTDDSAP